MEKSEKQIFISYTARYVKKTEKQIKQLEKIILNQMLQDKKYAEELLTIHQAKTNKVKAKKIIKIILLNLIRAIHNDSELIISLDNNTLRQNDINLRLYSSIINKLYAMNYIIIHKGFFHSEEKSGKRSRIEASNKLKNYIIKVTTEYTEAIEARYGKAVKVVVGEKTKVKLTFVAIESNSEYSCFVDSNYIVRLMKEYKNPKQKIFKLTINNKNRIKNIEVK